MELMLKLPGCGVVFDDELGHMSHNGVFMLGHAGGAINSGVHVFFL